MSNALAAEMSSVQEFLQYSNTEVSSFESLYLPSEAQTTISDDAEPPYVGSCEKMQFIYPPPLLLPRRLTGDVCCKLLDREEHFEIIILRHPYSNNEI